MKYGDATESEPRRKRQILYGLLIGCISIACLVYAFDERIAESLTLSAPTAARVRIQAMYKAAILTPMAQPAQPLPAAAFKLVPALNFGVWRYVALALVITQTALIARRLMICAMAGQILAAPALTRFVKILLSVGLASWCIAVLVELLPRLVTAFYGGPIGGLALASAYTSAFVLPLVWLPAVNLIGPIFFALELHSLASEGVFPRDKGQVREPSAGTTRHGASAIKITLVLIPTAAVVGWLFWPNQRGIEQGRVAELDEHFEAACKSVVIEIHRRATDTRSVLFPHGDGMNWCLLDKLDFTEEASPRYWTPSPAPPIRRHTRRGPKKANGCFESESVAVAEPAAQYEVTVAWEPADGRNFSISQTTIKDRRSGEVLGTFRKVRKHNEPISNNANSCPRGFDPDNYSGDLVLYVLGLMELPKAKDLASKIAMFKRENGTK